MKKIIIIKYGELSTKKDNINFFISCLKDNIKSSLTGLNANITYDKGRMFIEGPEENYEAIMAKLKKTFGIHEINIAYELENNDFENIKESLKELIKDVEFFGNTISVNKNVLIPRNETEQLCEMISKTANGKKVLDLCTGSGCIGLGIKANSSADVTLSDISAGALKVAKQNAINNGLDVKIIKSDLFNNITDKFDIIVCNPPYVSNDFEINNIVKHIYINS